MRHVRYYRLKQLDSVDRNRDGNCPYPHQSMVFRLRSRLSAVGNALCATPCLANGADAALKYEGLRQDHRSLTVLSWNNLFLTSGFSQIEISPKTDCL